MRALVFGVTPETIAEALPADAGTLEEHLRATPMGLEQVDDPTPVGPDWVVLQTRLCGICGSDAKQVHGHRRRSVRRVDDRVHLVPADPDYR